MTLGSLPESPWYVQAFDRAWLDLYPDRSDEEARANAPAIANLLGLQAGESLLDVSCGAGRYARAFAALGMRVTGVDLSKELLEEARRRSGDLPGTPRYFRCDARQMPFARQYDAAVSLFTSIGYFDTRADDLAILKGVRRALVRGGTFLLDFLNEARVRATLVPAETREVGPYHMQIRRRIADGPHGACVYKHVEARMGNDQTLVTSFEERVRLYTFAEIRELLSDAGLHLLWEEGFGDLRGETPFGPDSERLVCVTEAR
jgi:SAM-dependent methyltransferase